MKRLVLACALISTTILMQTGATYASPDKSKETPGIAAHQATQGAFKRDRRITRHILRSECEQRTHESHRTR